LKIRVVNRTRKGAEGKKWLYFDVLGALGKDLILLGSSHGKIVLGKSGGVVSVSRVMI